MATSVQKDLLAILETVKNSGTFFSQGELTSTHPGLLVEDLGLIALPLEKKQAAALKKKARQAPYGKGTETVVDTKVRRVWEIDAKQVVFANPLWKETLAQAIQKTKVDLGLKNATLNAHFYKLLIYEKGGFFLPHRDGEKMDRMVATMVIALPSSHEGGELIIRHDQQEIIVDFSVKSNFQTQFASFYADCEHEVRPVTSGFRLALVYNLTLENQEVPATAPTVSKQIAETTKLLEQWTKDISIDAPKSKDETPSKLAVILDHKYSMAELNINTLKGIDRVRADVLIAAAAKANCDASIALVTYWEQGEPLEDDFSYGYGYGRGRRNKYRGNKYSKYNDFDDDSDDETEDEDDNDIQTDDVEMGEVYEHSHQAENFTDAAGIPLTYGKMNLNSSEIVTKKPLNDGKPDEQEFEGYTGNEGMTLDRWYHRSAVIIWPTKLRFLTLCGAGIKTAIAGLSAMVQQWGEATKDKQESLKESCTEFADQIISIWRSEETGVEFNFEIEGLPEIKRLDSTPGHKQYRKPKEEIANVLLTQLDKLDDVNLISKWITNVLARDLAVIPDKLLSDILHKHGWKRFRNELETLFALTDTESLLRHAWLLANWAVIEDKNKERRETCSSLVEIFMQRLLQWNPQQSMYRFNLEKFICTEILQPLIISFIALDEMQWFDCFVELIRKNKERFDISTAQATALMGLETWLRATVKKKKAPLGKWLKTVVSELKSREQNPPEPPSDWRRKSPIVCNCDECKELSRYLKDPNEETLHLQLLKSRIDHLVHIEEGNKLDTTHFIDRRRRPFTIIFTKTSASFDAEMERYDTDVARLVKMQLLLKWHESL